MAVEIPVLIAFAESYSFPNLRNIEGKCYNHISSLVSNLSKVVYAEPINTSRSLHRWRSCTPRTFGFISIPLLEVIFCVWN